MSVFFFELDRLPLPGSVAVLAEVATEGGFEIDVITHVDVLAGRDFILETVSADRLPQWPDRLASAAEALALRWNLLARSYLCRQTQDPGS